MSIDKANIYSLEDLKKLEVNLEALSLVTEKTAQTAQTLAFDLDLETNEISLLTTNDFPTQYHQVEDRLMAQ